MSNYTQDIPIRPRYGLNNECQENVSATEDADNTISNNADANNAKNTKGKKIVILTDIESPGEITNLENPVHNVESDYNDDCATSSHVMRHYVAKNLTDELRLQNLQCDAEGEQNPIDVNVSNLLVEEFNAIEKINENILNDLEIETQYLATSVDNLFENLCNLLHSISSITADTVEVYRNSVNKLTDSMDANIKSMYTIMAKTEEITKSMPPTERLLLRM